MSDTISKRVKELIKKINHLDYCYYVRDDPFVTDDEYDQIYRELQSLERNHPSLVYPDSPTQRVSGGVLDGFEEVEHSIPMLSLNNAISDDEFSNFYERTCSSLKSREVEFVGELKLDGLAVSLIYEEGFLITGSTRGDGNIGENITNNIKTIKSIPIKIDGTNLPRRIEVRGEVYMSKTTFEHLNQKAKNNHERTFANARNAAAGSLRQLNPKIAAQRKLSFRAYSIYFEGIEKSYSSQIKSFQYLRDLGFPVVEQSECLNSLEKCKKFYKTIVGSRDNLPFEIDGVVFKLNLFSAQISLGVVSRAPKWAIAYKFQAETSSTLVRDIEVQIGRTGALTPVAHLKPVSVGGVNISKATLHNFDELEKKDVRIGDSVIVRRAGDVIPEIVSVDIDKRPKNSKPFKLAKNFSAAQFKKAQLIRMIIHSSSKHAFDIEGLGNETVNALVEKGLINNFSDIFTLQETQLLKLDGFAGKSSSNLIKSIKKSSQIELDRFLYSLGILGVGRVLAKNLAAKFLKLSNLSSATIEELEQVDDVGVIIARSIHDFFRSPLAIDIEKLIENGVKITENNEVDDVVKNGFFSNKSVVITGKFESLNRSDIISLLEKHGARVLGSLSKKTDFLICGEQPGSKLKRANELNVQVIEEADFLSELKQ